MLSSALHYSHALLKECLQPGDLAVDATMGNGHDTRLLAELVGRTGQVWSFDIQEQALNATKKLLQEQQLAERVHLICEGHETVLAHLPAEKEITAAIFNLGYLPRSDKSVITLPETTELAMTGILSRLKTRGRMIIVAYYGHTGGEAELAMVDAYCRALPQEHFNVLRYAFINQQNQPPILYCVEKKRGH